MTLEDIGQQLKSARDSKGLSLSQIQERTKIPYNHLQAIDNGQPDELPESVYVSGYIKRYADCVGLDGQQLVDAFRFDLEKSTHKNGRFLLFSKPVKLEPVKMPGVQHYQRVKIDQAPPNILKSVPFYAFWIVVVLGLVVYLATHQQNEAQDSAVVSLKDSTNKIQIEQQQKTLPTATNGNSTNEVNQSLPADSGSDVRIILNASQHVWVEVKSVSTGEVQYTGFLEMGDRRDFHDPQGLEIESRDAGSLTFERDGKIENFGPPGKDLQKTFLAKGSATDILSNSQTQKTVKSQPDTPTIATVINKKSAPSKRSPTNKTTAQEKSNSGSPSRQYLPGEFYGQNGTNSRGMDVPYRYSE